MRISFVTLQISTSNRVSGMERMLGGARGGRGCGRGRGGGRTGTQGRWQKQSGRGGAGYTGGKRRQHPRVSGCSRRRPACRQMMARRRMLMRIEVRMRPGGRVQAVTGGARKFRGRAFRRAVPQYPIDAADRRRRRVTADSWNRWMPTLRSMAVAKISRRYREVNAKLTRS